MCIDDAIFHKKRNGLALSQSYTGTDVKPCACTRRGHDAKKGDSRELATHCTAPDRNRQIHPGLSGSTC